MSFPNPSNSPTPWKPSASIPNPYGDPSAATPGYPPTGGLGGGPYGTPTQPPSPARSGNGCVIAGIIGGVITLIGICCGGCGFVGYFALDAQQQEIARKLSVDYRNDPKVKEQVGDVQEVTYNWSASFAHEESDIHVYDVRGDKGSGQFVVETIDDEILSVKFQNGRGEWDLPSGGEEAAAPSGDESL